MEIAILISAGITIVYSLGLLYYASGAKECSKKLDQILIELKNPRLPR
jgi:hypothetical protein